MRRVQAGIRLLAGALFALTGCYSTHHIIVKAPPHEEEYNLPPDGDPRYKNPVQYPKESLNQPRKKDEFDPSKAGSGMGPVGGGMGGGGMGGMGGMGGGGMGGMGGMR